MYLMESTGQIKLLKHPGYFPMFDIITFQHFATTVKMHLVSEVAQPVPKLENGITMHNLKKCIGCKYCEFNCPYGVIYFNWTNPHKPWKNREKVMEGTASPAEEVAKVGGKTIPYYNPEREDTLAGIRPKGVVEKCTFCDHLVKRGKLPRCVDACPADARIFGDMNDPNSKVRQLLGKFRPFRLREQIGTEPHVFYIRNFNPANYQPSKGGI